MSNLKCKQLVWKFSNDDDFQYSKEKNWFSVKGFSHVNVNFPTKLVVLTCRYKLGETSKKLIAVQGSEIAP